MSLTSYRAAPPRVKPVSLGKREARGLARAFGGYLATMDANGKGGKRDIS
jgi:hypothetical protein